ncbi:GNAT family N-acetyltransferase [Massilia antarctica]|uniref:GNAT family N-acetyltransferase n=1 Tax=Massilia antarctica TaxID=2765360 RepID=UPI0006BB6777|nr:GNAT family N-acetyltransferase [Massilia sp. H27-R4]MCY0911876.1 GNAT family N-acetyltransferase [Massilia sp. H27-R4]CUI06669.1 Histone acetyltransferase HPA2 and related acetyltransferases [Janthinobacterium sp. CG23_2]CUU30455.1 Histone acetyltransferase HPA2 and related acetyltransferases [Janthinobacterium sp. CG23_2]
MFTNPFSSWLSARSGRKTRRKVLVKQLHERDRHRVLRHFLALDNSDRLLRFGTNLPDELVEAYVAKIDFSHDTVYGVYNPVFKLVAVGHLAFAPTQASTHALSSTTKDIVAEFGVSVSASARGLGIGSKLFERAAIRCRNLDVDTLYMHCLSSNQTMMHIAKKAGMEIQRDYGEADAYLRLLPPDPASMLREAIDEQFATIDYTLKANTRAAVKFFVPKK